ncbi:MAG: HEPN domain-containing protein [Bacteroidetes bacterium]|nr:HEPN domain-containing protein [Bacteroidota bacterium]
MNKTDIVKEWFVLAENDFRSAVFLKGMIPAPLEIICYHCQQCAEKLLKGFLAFNEEEIIKTHDLLLLNKICIKFDKKFSTIENHCLRLTDYSINIRYPASFQITEDDMELAIKDAEKIKDFITNVIDL